MKFDFHINSIDFKFETYGKTEIKLLFNGKHIKNFLIKDNIKPYNTVEIIFDKHDPSDINSYAILDKVFINGFDCASRFKEIKYEIDRSKHNVKNNILANNLYFGYVGSMSFTIEHRGDLLSRAAWVLADKEFEYVKWPLKGSNFRAKDFNTVSRDSLYMFTGCKPPNAREISVIVDEFKIKDLSKPVLLSDAKKKIENWINQSRRIQIKNFSQMKHFTISNGVTDSLNNVLNTNSTLYTNKKMYFHNGEILKNKDVLIKDVETDEIDENSAVLLELPSPWYSTQNLIKTIKKAKASNCYISLDLTWLPVANSDIEIDLELVDEIFFSMNKCWPIEQLRPAFRWSKTRINDSQTFDSEYGMYPKIPINIFMKLIDQFEIDYIVNKHKDDHEQICQLFELTSTDVLWFTRHKDFSHDERNYISDHFFLDDFVCVVNLLNHKDQYFW